MMKKLFSKIFSDGKVLGTVLINYLIASLLMILMLITSIDVIGRYGFNRPLPGSTELTEFCLGLLIFSTLPIICRKNQHISVDLLEGRLSPAFRRWSDLLMQAVLLVGMSFLGYGMYLLVERAQRDELVSEILMLPVSFFYITTTFLIFFSVLAIAFYISTLFRKDRDHQRGH